MHEFSICEELVRIMLSEAEKIEPRARRVKKARVFIGALRQIVPESLGMAYEVLTTDTIAEGSVLEMEFVPIKIKCKHCGWSGEIEDMFFQCKQCASGEIEILSGKELYLDRLEVEQDEAGEH
jgi:hydrogenase nickel incorporation protein HypA/HybF